MEANIQPRITDETRQLWALLDQIPDPEVPAISIVELGVIRDVQRNGNQVVVEMTPTYSGCPALKTMEEAVLADLQANGFEVTIRIVYKPAWTTDWLSEAAKIKLKAYGIAPPPRLNARRFHPLDTLEPLRISCPFCDSAETKLTSQFGSTACKSLYFCEGCRQPFELFKCH